jgi:type II secretory pathway component GspD/PulD (secretin)
LHRPLGKDDHDDAWPHGAAPASVPANVYHIVPVKEAMRRVPGLQVPGKLAPGFGVYIVPLQYVSAVEMQNTLQPFMSEGTVLRVDEGRNLLLLGGSHQEISSLLNIIATFDVDWMAGMSFGLYPLEYVDAKTLAGELAEVFSDTKSPINGVVRFVPLARLNCLRTELVVLITPHVIRTADESEDVMDDLRRQFQGLRRLLPQWQARGPDGTKKPSIQGKAGAAKSEAEGQPGDEKAAKQ